MPETRKFINRGFHHGKVSFILWRTNANYHMFNSENLFERVPLKSWEICTKRRWFVPKWGKYKRDGNNTQILVFLTWEHDNKRSETSLKIFKKNMH